MNFELFDIVRESSSTGIWSKGVELARRDAVTGDRRTGEEILLRVAQRDSGMSRSVTLWPEDGDWACDCGGEDPCEHVAAAVIALKRAFEKGEDLPTSKTAGGRIVYRLIAVEGELHLKRYIQVGESEEPLVRPLGALAKGEGNVAATQDDWNLEVALGYERFGPIPAKLWQRLIPSLRLLEDVRFEGQTTQFHTEAVGWEAVIRNDEAGIRVSVGPAASIQRVFKNGMALSSDGLHPYQEPALTAQQRAFIGKGAWFGPRDFATVASEIMPQLEKIVPVRLFTARLPGRARLAPQGKLTLTHSDGIFRVRADLVYGDPPLARLEGDRLVALGDRMPERDREAENAVTRRLGQCAGLSPGEERPVSFAEAVALRESARDLQVSGNALSWLQDRGTFNVEPWLENGTLGVAIGQSEGGASFVPFERILGSDGVISLGPRGFGRIASERWRQLFPLLQELHAAYSKKAEPAAQTFIAAHLPRSAAERDPDLRALLDDAGDEGFEGFQGQLRDYQKVGARWLRHRARTSGGALLADDMGLGKTVQVAAILKPRTLIVCPASLVFNWEAELKRFRPDLSVRRYLGAGRSLAHPADVLVTTYGTLRVDAAPLAEKSWDCVVLDESQAIKNPQSQTAQAAFALRAQSRIALTGTPVENALTDLWSQFQFVLPGYLGDEVSFRAHYVGGAPESAVNLLRAKIRPFILRRLKADVAPELPPRLEILLPVELSAEEKDFYDALHLAARKELLQGQAEELSVMALLEAILRLRQAATAPALVPGAPTGIGSAKLDLLVEKLAEACASGHKALVFSQWTSCLDLIAARLTEAGHRYLRLDGATRDRAAVVQGFQTGEAPVLLMSLKAGGVGLTLTAADHVFIVDPWWNPAAEDQAADRAHRIGQNKTVLIHRLISSGTLEEKILRLQESKRALATSLVEGTGSPITRAELLELLGD